MEQFNWKTLTTIQAGIYICVPAIMAGHFLCKNFGFNSALISLGLGSVVLWGAGLIFAKMAVFHKKTLIDLVEMYFGKNGAIIGGIAFAISLIGWFALQTEMMSISLSAVFPFADKQVLNLFLSALITISVLFGMKGIGRLSDLAAPFLLIMMLYIMYKIYNPHHHIISGNYSIIGIPMVISFSIAGVVDAPTYFCNSKTLKDSYIATTLVYLMLLPFMAVVGMFIALYSDADNFLQAINNSGSNSWKMLVSIFVILAGWTTNNGNLYSASVALAPCGSKLTFYLRTILLGTLGFGLTFFEGLENLAEFLSAICIVVGALGAALIIRFITQGFRYVILSTLEQKFYQFLMAAATVTGALSQIQWINITGFGFLDSFLITFFGGIIYEGGAKWITKKKSQKLILKI